MRPLAVRLISDITETCEENRTDYTPEIDNIGVDFGLATLLATSEGDLYGRGLLADLIRIDRQITSIASALAASAVTASAIVSSLRTSEEC